jgi:hypothetical protein
MTTARKSHAHEYGSMPIAEKRTAAIARVREPAVTCPICDMQVMPTDLLAHLQQRCDGPREPGPSAKWVNWKGALAMGISTCTLKRWVRKGHVRSRGGRGDRLYLVRDLAVRIALRATNRPR